MTRTIWLASYPKSGNTWLRMLIANLSAEDEPADINALPERGGIASARARFDDLLLIDSGLLTPDEIDVLRPRLYEELAAGALDHEHDERNEPAPALQFVKVHDAYRLMPNGEPLLAGARGADGAVVIVRDPRDVASSLAHHTASTIDQAIAFMSDGNAAFSEYRRGQGNQFRQRFSTWSAHVASWLEQSDIPLYLVRYEDMCADAAAVLRGVLTFAGRVVADDEIRRAVKFADFAELRRQEKERGFSETPRYWNNENFFRRGEAGAWRDELTRGQVARIEADHAPMMRRLGYELSSAAALARAG